MTRIDAKLKKPLLEALNKARAGKLDWLHRLVLRAGYREPGYATSLFECATFFGVTPTAVQKWWAAGCPQKNGHGHDLSAMVRWRTERDRDRARAPENGGIPPDAKGRREHYLAELARLKYEEQEGRLIPVAEHERALTDRSAWIVAVLDALAPVLGPRVAGKTTTEARRIIGAQCRKLREQAYGRTTGE